MERQRHIFVNGIDWKALGLKAQPTSGMVDFTLCRHNVTVYNHKYMMQGDFSNEGIVNGFFSDLKQPNKSKVDQAMLLVIDEDYALKAGGECHGDSQYSSSYKILIADPKTGLDKEVVVMKKWSTNFQDIIITAKEIRELFRANLTQKQKRTVLQDDLRCHLAFTFKAFQGFKVNWGGKYRKVSSDELKMLLATCRDFPRSKVEAFIDDLIARRLHDATLAIVEDQPGVNKTQQHKERNLQTAAKLEEFKELLFGVEVAA